jgi:hypothetical protein
MDQYELATLMETVESDLADEAPRAAICVIMQAFSLDVDDVETAWTSFKK